MNMLQYVDVGQNEITKDKAAFVIQFVGHGGTRNIYIVIYSLKR